MNPSSEREVTDEVHINSTVERKAMEYPHCQEHGALLLVPPKEPAGGRELS